MILFQYMTPQCRSSSVADHVGSDALCYLVKLAARCHFPVQNRFGMDHTWRGRWSNGVVHSPNTL